MAGLGAKLFASFTKLTAADVNGYLADQSIMRFATSVARDAAFGGAGEPTLAEGMTCYLDDTNVLQSYTGSAWVSIASSSGAILQVIYGQSTSQVPNAGTAYVDAGISATITPKSTTSVILVTATTPIYMADSDCNVFVKLLRTTTDLAVSVQNDSNSANAHQTSVIVFRDSPSTTSATTYKVQWKNNTAGKTSYVMNNSTLGSIVLMEISA
jgi:hypothetical protein